MKRLPRPKPVAMQADRSVALAVLALLCLTLIAYRGVTQCDFVNFDDDLYVTENPYVLAGLKPASLAWAWTTFHTGNWHPLTWMSLGLDAAVYGRNSVGFHLTNVVLHALNTALLFLLLRGLTAAFWRSALVAALFAVHPLHVESVAWITERKDVISTLFALLALFAYGRYVVRPSLWGYACVAACQALSLLAKPMLVTLPGLLLLLDWWPLNRWHGDLRGGARLVLEKLPLLLISLLFAAVTMSAQSTSAAVVAVENLAPATRLANSLLAVVAYLEQTFWPDRLAVHYPLVGAAPVEVMASGWLIFGVTGLLFWWRRPPLLVGWLWFLMSLVPVIGLVQVGDQARADRYTYLPHMGLFIALIWGAAELLNRLPLPRLTQVGLAGVLLLACCAVTDRQVAVWRNSNTLWQHALDVLEPNPSWKVLNNLSSTLITQAFTLDDHAAGLRPGPQRDRLDKASRTLLQQAALHLERAIAVAKGPHAKAMSLCSLGLIDIRLQRDARAHLLQAIELDSFYALPHQILGDQAVGQKKPDEAEQHFRDALQLQPNDAATRQRLGYLLLDEDRAYEADEHFSWLVQNQPRNEGALFSLGKVRLAEGNDAEAMDLFGQVAALQPSWSEPLFQIGLVQLLQNQPAEATANLRKAQALDGKNPSSRHLAFLAFALDETGQADEARRRLAEARTKDLTWIDDLSERAWGLATDADDRRRDGPRALLLARVACRTAATPSARQLDVLAAAQAEMGQFAQAVATARRALDASAPVPGMRQRLELYEAGKKFRQE